jgi:alpha-tubulin suppressor-like RCC1 family protein
VEIQGRVGSNAFFHVQMVACTDGTLHGFGRNDFGQLGISDLVVREVFMIHVGGTRCVTSSTDNIMKIYFRITLNVEFIRGYIYKFLFYV